MQWGFLVGGILTEVVATCSLRAASLGRPRWYGVVVVGYVLSFVFLTLALNAGLPLGVAYGIWAAAGVALTAVASHLLFREPLTPVMVAGLALIAVGVLLIELGSTH